MDRNCSSLREELVIAFGTELAVASIETGCIITMPMKTVDDRYVGVFVEPSGAFLTVHDGGKSTAELFAQGIHATDTQVATLNAIARVYGATLYNGRFQMTCKVEQVQDAVFAITQCASLAMVDVLSHRPKVEDEMLATRVARALNAWRPPYVEIQHRVHVAGKIGGDHIFDFVSVSKKRGARTVAVKLLPLSVGANWQAGRYGFLAYDIADVKAVRWPRLAIVSRVEEWSDKALEVIRSASQDVILLYGDREERVESELPDKMTELTEAA
jgi:hypothetical protein